MTLAVASGSSVRLDRWNNLEGDRPNDKRALPCSHRDKALPGHIDKWRTQRRIEVVPMKPRKLPALL